MTRVVVMPFGLHLSPPASVVRVAIAPIRCSLDTLKFQLSQMAFPLLKREAESSEFRSQVQLLLLPDGAEISDAGK